MGYDQAHELVPVFAGSGFEDDFVMTVAMIDSGDSDLEHQAGPACVGDHEITAAAEDKQRKTSRSCELNCLRNLGDRLASMK